MASPSSSSQSYSRNSPYMNFLTKMNSKEEDSKFPYSIHNLLIFESV